MFKYIYTVDISRKLTYINVEKDISDEEYTKVITLLGIFKIKRTFVLKNKMDELESLKPKVKGFKND